ncbi:MAG TPA: protein kinase [Candidatus Binatia bacterium]|nr:protein kinase [Candidatus Binatia bacterium]
MNPERWQQVCEVLAAAVALPANERAGYLNKACGQDVELRQEVESLLDSHEEAASQFLNFPAADVTSALGKSSSRIGSRIGVYQIEEEIGRGGMGEVYRAVRADGQYKKEVAIKLVRGGHDSAAVFERFLHERQILASLDHPNIARLFDGGTTQEGIPYLVMELVEGTAIDQYCEKHNLDVDGRLRLFTQGCAAVQYAHQRLVIHRDIKPSNILVTAEGVPKLLDFGIAKLLDSAAGPETTLPGAMTPEYASPEQVRGEPITTATDVYSLGVVLYRLLTGLSPYPRGARTPLEFARVICEAEPTKPSSAAHTWMSRNTHSPLYDANAQQKRRVSSARQFRKLKGDLDNIVLKALRKEPSLRYASVEQFAEDIRRHIEGLPVTAARGSWTYRTKKFVRRHKLGMTTVAVLLAAIGAGVAATVRESRIAAANQRRAEQRFSEVRKLADSLMYEIHGSVESLPGAARARQLIVQRSQEYLDSLAKEASGDISLQRELAAAYDRLGTLQGSSYESSIGDAEAARKSLQKATMIREAIAVADPNNSQDQIALARAYELLGRAQWLSPGGSREGQQSLERAVTIAETQAREHSRDPGVLQVLAQGYQYIGDLQGGSGLRGGTSALSEALRNHLKALLLLKEIAEGSSEDPEKRYLLARAAISVGDDYLRTAEVTQALDYYQQAEKIVEPLANHANNAKYSRGLAICLTRIGDAQLMSGRAHQALVQYRKEEEVLRPLAALDPHDMVAQLTLVTSEGDIGHALVESGRVREGTVALRQAMADTLRVTQEANDSYAHALLASTYGLLGEALELGNDINSALSRYQHALDLYAIAVVADPGDLEDAVNTVIMRNHIGRAYLRTGDPKTAAQQYEIARVSAENLLNDSPGNIEVLYALADTYAGLGDLKMAGAKSSGRSGKTAAFREANAWFEKSLGVWQRIPHRGPVSPNGFEAGDPRDVARHAKLAAESASGRS